jgi:hypothetical protein
MPGPGSRFAGETGDNTNPSKSATALYDLEQSVAESIRLRGSDHPETLLNRAKLARRRRKAGDLPGAIRDYENLLPDLVRALGREDPGTLDVGTTLSTDHVESGDQRRAITDYERRVQDLLNRLGATYSRLL